MEWDNIRKIELKHTSSRCVCMYGRIFAHFAKSLPFSFTYGRGFLLLFKVNLYSPENHLPQDCHWNLKATFWCIFHVLRFVHEVQLWKCERANKNLPRGFACVFCSICLLESLVYAVKELKSCLKRKAQVESNYRNSPKDVSINLISTDGNNV